jgi:hypothetical protein
LASSLGAHQTSELFLNASCASSEVSYEVAIKR